MVHANGEQITIGLAIRGFAVFGAVSGVNQSALGQAVGTSNAECAISRAVVGFRAGVANRQSQCAAQWNIGTDLVRIDFSTVVIELGGEVATDDLVAMPRS